MTGVKENENVNETVKKSALQIETAEKWKTTYLVQQNAENWLSIQGYNTKLAKTMHCKLYHKYENEICRLLRFNYTWSRNGCVHLQFSDASELKTGGLHKAACHKILTKKGWGPREDTERVSVWQEPGQMSLVNSFNIANTANFVSNKIKSETAYFIPKEELSISK